jgi:LacI family gluconate utilization system Gnt-I transcriptional repressor
VHTVRKVHKRVKTQRVTMTEIARVAGVSQAAVSLVLAGSAKAHRIPPATAARIRETAKKLGYTVRERNRKTVQAAAPSFSVKSPSKNQSATRSVGVIFVEYRGLSGDVLYSPAYLGLCRAATGHEVWQYGAMGWANFGEWLHSGEMRVHDGVVVFTHREVTAADLKPLEDLNVPFILMNRDPQGLSAPRVLFDAYNMAYGLMEMLLEEGHRRIAMLGTRSPIPSAVGQRNGYREALQAAGCHDPAIEVLETAGWDDAQFREGVRALLKRRPDVTALYAFFDRHVEGIYAGAREAGRRIPDDLSVVATGGQPVGQRINPPLTTMRYPMLEMGEAAFRLLERLWRGEPVPPRTIIPGELLHGGSVGPARA